MPAPYKNKNAKGKKRVERERISLSLGISQQNGLLPLFESYLSAQGIEPTRDNIAELAREWAYHGWGERLKREIEMNDILIV